MRKHYHFIVPGLMLAVFPLKPSQLNKDEAMAMLEIHQFLCWQDNYGVLIHDRATGLTASIDAPQESAVREALKRTGFKLTHIFTTHHHHDHVEGHAGLKRETGCKIYGP